MDSPITKRIERESTSVCYAIYEIIIPHEVMEIKEKRENHLQTGNLIYKNDEPICKKGKFIYEKGTSNTNGESQSTNGNLGLQFTLGIFQDMSYQRISCSL